MRRQRIGLIVPCTNPILEPDIYRTLPSKYTLHTERVWYPKIQKNQADDLVQMNEDVPRAARYIASMEPDVIMYGCTSGSFIQGPGYDRHILSIIKKETDVPVVPTSTAVVAALRHLGLKRLSVATPYQPYYNQCLPRFFEAEGFEVLNVEGEPSIINNPATSAIGAIEPDDIRKFVLTVVKPGADCLFISCTGWRSLEIADDLECRLGIKVVTSTQATIWRALKVLNHSTPINGYGALLRSFN